MDALTLTRLRVAFLLLGATLLAALFLLVCSAQARLEAQRRLRHQIVAERIFDEMERELTALLQLEDARPSTAYDSQSTRVQTWAPFVVGYFTQDQSGPHAIARGQLDATRVAQVEHAARACWLHGAAEREQAAATKAKLDAVSAPAPASKDEAKAGVLEAKKSREPAALEKQESVLRKLNRGAEQRPQFKGAKSKSFERLDDDPLSGIDSL